MKKLLIIGAAFFLAACNNKVETQESHEKVQTSINADFLNNAVIYEVNIRHYSQEGTIEGFNAHLERLKQLGVDILWIMPVQPIGIERRKALGDVFASEIEDSLERSKYLGSPYSISNYTAVNPDYGTVEDFKEMVSKAHELGMRVILDWVGNHTAWDHPWITEHPDWYTQKDGQITDPLNEKGESIGWTDVADLNYDNPAMRTAMIEAMSFWLTECNIDGFRCDVAMEIPGDFWNTARRSLDKIKPVFMLAESEEHNMAIYDTAFDAYYAWDFHAKMNQLAKGEINAQTLMDIFDRQVVTFNELAIPMMFITNHDENSWNGTVSERMGDHWRPFAVLSFTLPGLPLIYSGQEAGLNHRLKFFEKDQIQWNAPEASDYTEFYSMLCELKHTPPLALKSPVKYHESHDPENDLVAFYRGSNSEMLIVLNFSNEIKEIAIDKGYESVFGVSPAENQNLQLKPFEFSVLQHSSVKQESNKTSTE